MRDFWRRWLQVASAVTVIIGAGTTFLSLSGGGRIQAGLFELLYFPGHPDLTAADTLSFALGVAGGVMTGWGVMLLGLFGRGESAEVTIGPLVSGLLVWFALDGAASVASGAIINLAGNTLFLAMFVPPLAAALRHRRTGEAGSDHRLPAIRGLR
jgi:hypothetical protein